MNGFCIAMVNVGFYRWDRYTEEIAVSGFSFKIRKVISFVLVHLQNQLCHFNRLENQYELYQILESFSPQMLRDLPQFATAGRSIRAKRR